MENKNMEKAVMVRGIDKQELKEIITTQISDAVKKTKTNKVYLALYCECIHESSYATLSIHRTRKGAEKSIEHHKQETRNEFIKIHGKDVDEYGLKWNIHQAWGIVEEKIKD